MIASYFTGSIDCVVTEHFLLELTQVITFPRCQPFVLWWRESIGSGGHHCQPGVSKNDTWMTASCKGDIWSDTDMLHYRCNVCSSGVTSAALIPAFILPASPLPNARAVCHGWFGNKMRKVLSQRQKSPFHLALCHPFHTNSCEHTHSARTHAHAQTHKLLCTRAQADTLCVRCVRFDLCFYTHIQDCIAATDTVQHTQTVCFLTLFFSLPCSYS